MSLANVKEYARRCGSDPELRKHARAIGVENIDEHIRTASDMGLDWNWSDLKAFQKELSDAQEGLEDLSEEELEEVAGGAFSVTLVASLAVGAAVGAGVGAVAAGAGVGASAGTAAAAGGGGW